jgi:hypothetical protein
MDSVHVVACCHQFEPAAVAARLNRLGERLGVRWNGLLIDNAAQAKAPRGNSALDDGVHRWRSIAGDNTDLDFSAYMAGAEWLAEQGVRQGLFLNDSLFRLHAALTNLQAILRLWSLVGEIQLPAIAGKADPYTTIVHANPWSGLGCYVSSYCFILNRQALSILTQLPRYAEVEGLAGSESLLESTWGSGLTPAFREFLRANLAYRSSPYLWRGFERHEVDAALLRRKARCIYFEHRLSGEIARTGCLLPSNAGVLWQTRLFLAERWAQARRTLIS